MKKQPLLVIVGPTASGKTALSIELAKEYDCEIISFDSMQIYKGMDIATAKPTIDEMQGIPHHLISCIDCDSPFSVADFVGLAKEKIKEISLKGKLPLLVGGTGLYINSLIDNIKFDDTASDINIRNELFCLAKEKGNMYVLNILKEIDSDTAETLHENNLNRIVRAIEYYRITGKKLSQQKIDSRKEESPYNPLIIGIAFKDRQKLYERINNRVDIMLEQGLEQEARNVYNNESLATACQAIGYKELIPYFNGEQSLEDCVEILKQQTRRYAKRQLTWFRRDARINWVYPDEYGNIQELYNKVKKIIANSTIL